MNRKILESNGQLLAQDDVVADARKALRDYYEDVQTLRNLQDLRVECPGKPHGHPNEPPGHPNAELWQEPSSYSPQGGKIWNQYHDSDVAYLCPEPQRPARDRLRWWLQHIWSDKRLDDIGAQQQLWYAKLIKEYKEAIKSDPRCQSWNSLPTGNWKMILSCIWFRVVLTPLDWVGIKLIRPKDPRLAALRHQIKVLGNRFHVSPVVDVWSRWIIAMVGVGMLIIPLLALTYIPQSGVTKLAAVLFTLSFGTMMAFFTRAGNTEILGAVAGYVAVLLVFLSRAG